MANQNNKQRAVDVAANAETTIELKLAITKVIKTPTDAALARTMADKAVRAILHKLDDCDQVQVISDKRFPDLSGDKD